MLSVLNYRVAAVVLLQVSCLSRQLIDGENMHGRGVCSNDLAAGLDSEAAVIYITTHSIADILAWL